MAFRGFRYRGGTKGFLARSIVNAKARRNYSRNSFANIDNEEGSPTTNIIAITLACVIASLILAGFIFLCNKIGLFGVGIGLFIILAIWSFT